MKDVIIIGGGPAGIVSGIYGARKNLNVLLLTKDFIGQVGNAGVVENWPGEKKIMGPELISGFKKQLEGYDVEIKEEEVAQVSKVEDGFLVEAEEGKYSSQAVIVATGRNPRPLGIPGEEEYVGKGVSYCVTCDGALFKGKKVAVVGGGNSGLEGALELSDYTEKVFILEVEDNLQGDEFLINRIEERENIEVLTGVRAKKIIGDDFVNELVYEGEEENSLQVSGIFVQVGSLPASAVAGDLVDYNDNGEIVIDLKTCKTKTEGLFAAGDVTIVRDKQVVVATGEGCKALISAYNYIKN